MAAEKLAPTGSDPTSAGYSIEQQPRHPGPGFPGLPKIHAKPYQEESDPRLP